MVLVIFILIFMYILAVIFSTIRFKIEKIDISNINNDNKVIYDYQIYFELLFLDIVKIFSIKINKAKVNKINSKIDIKKKMQNVDIKKFEKDFSKIKIKEILKKLNIECPIFNFDLEIGTEDVVITSGLIVIIASVLGIILARAIKKYEKDKINYQVRPIYQNKNLINLKLNCIIKVKMVHIISIIYVLVKKRRVEENERASNRGSYDYSYE